MTSIRTNALNDIYMDADGNLAMATGLDAVIQDCEHAMKAQLGEMPLALDQGVPTLQTIWDEWKPVQFEAYGRRMLLAVPGVTSVSSFTIRRENDIAIYEATIHSIYGEAVISNG